MMGRVKREIALIKDLANRRVTFRKRYGGIQKKLHDLGILCHQDIFLYVRDATNGHVRMYSSSDERFIPDYNVIRREDRKGPQDVRCFYDRAAKSSSIPQPHAREASPQATLDTCSLPDTQKGDSKVLHRVRQRNALQHIGECLHDLQWIYKSGEAGTRSSFKHTDSLAMLKNTNHLNPV